MSTPEAWYRWLILPVVLIIVVYIAWLVVDAFSSVTPEFGDTGWYIFGAIVTAVVLFIGYGWLQNRPKF